VLGDEHPDTPTSMAYLAFTLKSLRRDEEALSVLKTCFRLRKQIFGEQHPYTKSTLAALDRWQTKGSKVDL
jgi:hypothetical protein